MQSIIVYGPGCEKCQQLYAMVQQSLQKQGLCANLSKISNEDQLLLAGVLNTPALAIDAQIVLSGKLPQQQQLDTLLAKYVHGDSCSCNKQDSCRDSEKNACDCGKQQNSCDCDKHAKACACGKNSCACGKNSCDCGKNSCDCGKNSPSQQKSAPSGCCGGGGCGSGCGSSGGGNIFVRIAVWLLIALAITLAIQWMNGRI